MFAFYLMWWKRDDQILFVAVFVSAWRYLHRISNCGWRHHFKNETREILNTIAVRSTIYFTYFKLRMKQKEWIIKTRFTSLWILLTQRISNCGWIHYFKNETREILNIIQASSRERSRLGIGGFSASLMMLDSPDDDGSENAFSSRFKTRLLQSLYNLLVYLFLLFYNPVRKLMPKFISPWDF